eukprot:364218-Chlamydomonas_euryale.AAC.23
MEVIASGKASVKRERVKSVGASSNGGAHAPSSACIKRVRLYGGGLPCGAVEAGWAQAYMWCVEV